MFENFKIYERLCQKTRSFRQNHFFSEEYPNYAYYKKCIMANALLIFLNNAKTYAIFVHF